MATCKADDCLETNRIKAGYCHRHYERLRRNGKIQVRDRDPIRRFWSRVTRTGYCWEWTGAKANGYGRVAWRGRVVAAHRLAYELRVGPIPDGLELDHLCRNRGCVRPDHLDPVTGRVNKLRGKGVSAAFAGRDQCKNGHELTPENVYLWRNARLCRTCRASRVIEHRERRTPTVLTATCVMCGTAFSFERRVGSAPNVCSDRCRQDRRRLAARDHQRRKRAAAATI